jgi:hypothetical protein
MVHTMRDQKVVRLDIYGSAAQALEAVGLAGQAMSREDVDLHRQVVVAINTHEISDAIPRLAPSVSQACEAVGVSWEREAIRCLKRHLVRTTYTTMTSAPKHTPTPTLALTKEPRDA